jgi:glycosyltransferase involved in cell wall biosynthesis
MNKNGKPAPNLFLMFPSFRGGGAERVMVNLANRMHMNGVDVSCVVEVSSGPYRKNLSDEIPVRALFPENTRIKSAWRFREIFRIRGIFRANPSVVYMSTLRKFNILVALAWLLCRRKPRLYLREADTLDNLFADKKLSKRMQLHLMKYLYPMVHGVIANSHATMSDLVQRLHLDKNRISVINNPIDTETIGFNPIKTGIAKRDDPVLVGAGRLVPKKNFSDLIRVFALLKRDFPKSTLMILGDGPELENIRNLAEALGVDRSVFFRGFVNNPFAFFKAADVFVQTSLWEGFGYVLAEAFICGTPVVAYDGHGAMNEILQGGRYGMLVEPGNLSALHDAILLQLKSPIGAGLEAEFCRRFDSARISEAYADILLRRNSVRRS